MNICRPTLQLLALLPLLALTTVSQAQTKAKDDGSNISFKGKATIRTLASKGKNYEAESKYPIFHANTRLLRFVNSQISTKQRKIFNDWLVESKKSLKEYPNPVGAYEFQSNPSLSYFKAPKLVSLRFDSYQYTGGAHGMGIMDTRNFAIVDGKPKQLVLGDLFVPGTDYRKWVQAQVFAKLRKDEAATWIQDGSVKKLENSQFNNFSIEPDGLRWLFNQYEMGPYANGPIEVKLSLKELGAGFRYGLLK
ncbi:DUF3298/DUF4163 domain-containing protein [bacterium]|nr:MAG: DUF3298/DUF4163 domain-containing protein [bacterium]